MRLRLRRRPAQTPVTRIGWGEKQKLSDPEMAKLRADLAEALKKRTPMICGLGEDAQAAAEAGLGISIGAPVPAFSPRHHYGGAGTVHRTGTIDIQIDKTTGEVRAVWFRCLSLPFTVSEVQDDLPVNPVRDIAVEEITYAELPREDGSP